MKCSRMFFFGLMAAVAATAHAETYMAPLDQAHWRVQRSPLSCRLSQAVPRFGEAVFETVGGGRQRFWLRSPKNPLRAGPSHLTAVAPNWNPARQPVALGPVEIAEGTQPLQLSAQPAAQLLETLSAGLVPMFARPLQDHAERAASVALSPVNFRAAYRQYNDCVAQLWPVTFDDMQHTVVEFAPEQSELSAGAQKKIDFLLRYIALDRSVTHFEILGVSGDKQRRLENIELARQRAQQVSAYLVSRGVDAKIIESNYQGERGSKTPRRFVSIRLKRGAAVGG